MKKEMWGRGGGRGGEVRRWERKSAEGVLTQEGVTVASVKEKEEGEGEAKAEGGQKEHEDGEKGGEEAAQGRIIEQTDKVCVHVWSRRTESGMC